ncbi:hypothetical protein P6144_01030 [Sphingomonas sp. HITSZ_GF]|uniref:hypothetical protein n=1 Tax=Sphingomonas sp. HITSZ_GF TaxID=3037247 RepID=UPI00240DE3A1|nr:hypothetical protein [Sphingomonas sp. HITSZ_GF]MDG2532217.1 hypothetical protein [Sphingomonas sp. HITSZ_GF]
MRALQNAPAGESTGRDKRLAPLSLRLSREERDRLERDAAGQALGGYIKARLFADDPAQREHRRLPVRDQRTIAQALAQLGRSELAASLRDLAAAVRSGSLECDVEVRAALLTGCADIESIRSMLVAALGLKPAAAPRPPLAAPRQAFSPVAAKDAAR